MKELRQAIIEQGIGIGNKVVKVDMFLNHRIDTKLLTKIGEEFHKAFENEPVDIILTIEASGIAAALTTAQAFGGIPVVYAKKGKPKTINEDYYSAEVYSFTHDIASPIVVDKNYLPSGSNVLIIDDFIANGEAASALIEISRQAGCRVRGIGICIEKGFQPGAERLRWLGNKVVSLATVRSIQDGKVVLEDDVDEE